MTKESEEMFPWAVKKPRTRRQRITGWLMYQWWFWLILSVISGGTLGVVGGIISGLIESVSC